MMLRVLAATAVVVVPAALFGCSQAGGTDQFTVVVEADRARAAEDQARLQDMQRSLDQAKQELIDTRRDIAALRARLLETGAITADEAKKLEEREKALAARESGLPAGGGGAGGLTLADVEQLLRAQEDRLRTSLTGAPAAAAAAASAPSAAAAQKTDGDAAALLSEAARLRAERGLRPDDVAGGPALERRARESAKTGHAADAVSAAERLLQATRATEVDLAFVQKKYDRATGALEAPSLSAEGKAKVKKRLGQAVTAIGHGDAAAANEALNAALEAK